MTGWDRAFLALRLLRIDPAGLGGICLRARSSPARDAYLRAIAQVPHRAVRLHPNLTPGDIDGDIDLAQTLTSGTLTLRKGLLAGRPATLILTMAERAGPYLAARLGATLDAQSGSVLIALDEGAEDDERLPQALADRLAFRVVLEDIPLAGIKGFGGLAAPSSRPVAIPPDAVEHLVVLAEQLGIRSLRAPRFALHAAKANAALNLRDSLTTEDLEVAVALVYAHRATRLPQTEQTPEPPAESTEDSTVQDPDTREGIPDDVLLDAVRAALPPDLLAKLGQGSSKGGTGSGSGRKRIGNRRGRPLPPRQGRTAASARVDLVATLRAAVPWQTLRRRADPTRTGPIILPADLRHKRYEGLSDRLLIFTVDASGSAALARLGEAKGAVELLLGEAYARRDHVALISFRGTAAEVLLPPTRSLVQTKRRLAALPGGGGTPLAAGLTAALQMASQATRKGLTPTIVLLTDGRSNVALDGTGNRTAAAEDTLQVARQVSAKRLDSLVIDTGNRPDQSLRSLAETLNCPYIPMPRADARGVSRAVSAALEA